MQVKHTPGPWLIHSGCIYAACQMNERGTTHQSPLAQVTSDQDHDDYYEANCRLIAAAPDLLEALMRAKRHLLVDSDEWDLAEAAIAKAEGLNKETGDQQ
jgi:hypothetical protein